MVCAFFFFNDTATTEIYTLSLHDALPISCLAHRPLSGEVRVVRACLALGDEVIGLRVHDLAVAREHSHRLLDGHLDRKSTRLNSSHANISYAVFCLKKKKKTFILLTLLVF